MFHLEDIQKSDISLIHQLNESETPHVSSVTLSELEHLLAECIYAKKAMEGGSVAGFLIGFDRKADYSSMNFQWFKSRYPSFFYIDRVVVARSYKRKGVGRLLYLDVEQVARGRELPLVTCEVNIRPPNPESMAYHTALGYRSVGEQDTEGGKKRVSLLAKAV